MKEIAGIQCATVNMDIGKGCNVGAWFSTLKNVRKVYSEVKKAIEWQEWSEKAVIAINSDKALPPSPVSPEVFQEILENNKEMVSQLIIPEYVSPLPDTADIPVGKFEITRIAIRSRIHTIQDCILELEESKSTINYFTILAQALNAQIMMLERLRDSLWEFALSGAAAIWADLVGIAALDIDKYFLPTINETLKILAEKEKTAKNEYSERAGVIKRAAQNLNNELHSEAEQLKTELSRLDSIQEQVQNLQHDFIEATAKFNIAVSEKNRVETILQAAVMDVEETEVILDNTKIAIIELEKAIENKNEALKDPYICPGGYDWDNCTNDDHKDEKKDFIERQKLLQSQIIQIRSELQDAREAVIEIENELDKRKKTVEMYKIELKKAKAKTVVAEDAKNKIYQDLTSKVKFLEEEKHRTKADIFSADNRIDKDTITYIVKQMEG